jgi:hypothetical protein
MVLEGGGELHVHGEDFHFFYFAPDIIRAIT